MASYEKGKKEISNYIRKTYAKGSTCLDVGACTGVWWDLLGDHLDMDAIEIYTPNYLGLLSRGCYGHVFYGDIRYFEYNADVYDIIIFGDVIEHMSVEDAREVLSYAWPRCEDMIIAVPYQYKQGELYGNKWERHIQDDLTPEEFDKRYPGFTPLVQYSDYCYYHKGGI